MADGNYYDVLQVSPSADQEVIEVAYKRLAKKYHPDVSQDPKAASRMAELNEAWNVLGNPHRRRQYDERRQSAASGNEAEETLRQLAIAIDEELEQGNPLAEIERKLLAMGLDQATARSLIQDVLRVRRQLGKAEYRPRSIETNEEPYWQTAMACAAGPVVVILYWLWNAGWLLAIFKIGLWLLVVASLAVLVVSLLVLFTSPDQTRRSQWLVLAMSGASACLLILLILAWLRVPKSPGGLAKQSLGLATVTLVGAWEEEDPFFNDTSTWTGTAFVTEANKDRVVLVTNSHCLGLSNLAAAGENDAVQVLKYALVVVFPSGVERPVKRIAEEATDLDLARIEVAAEGLKQGVDYVLVPDSSGIEPTVGDRVIAVGNPLGVFANTQTFGNISAVRDRPLNGEQCRVFQHDAAINPGNSGGPLFVERDDRVHWIGINTWFVNSSVAQGIFFSIASDEARKAKYVWASADPAGAATLLRDRRKVNATVSARSR